MRYKKVLFLFIISIFWVMANSSFAQEEIFYMGNEYGINARAMGMGNTKICTSEDFSAAFNNPSALALIRRMELQGSFSYLNIKNNALFLDNEIEDEKNSTQLNTLGFVIPVPTYRGSLVFSIGYARIRDYESSLKLNGFNPNSSAYRTILDRIYPYVYFDEQINEEYIFDTTINDSVYQSETLLSSGGLKAWALSGAAEVQKDLFLGASINIWSGSEEHSLRFEEEDRENYYTKFDSTIREDGVKVYNYDDLQSLESTEKINSEFKAVNLKVGLLYRMNRFLSLGATVESPKTFTIKEKWEASDVVYYDDNSMDDFPPAEGEFEYKVQEPWVFGFGLSASLLNITLAGDVEFADWTQAKFLTDSPIEGDTKDAANMRIKENFRPVRNVHLGGEFSIPFLNTKLRAGVAHLPSIFKDADEKEDKKFVSLGASFLIDKQMMIDIGWSKGWWTDFTIDNLTNVQTEEERAVNRFLVTCSIRF